MVYKYFVIFGRILTKKRGETFIEHKCFTLFTMFSKRGQLGFIEFKYFIVGLIIGIVIGLVLIYLGTKGVIPFHIPFACPTGVVK